MLQYNGIQNARYSRNPRPKIRLPGRPTIVMAYDRQRPVMLNIPQPVNKTGKGSTSLHAGLGGLDKLQTAQTGKTTKVMWIVVYVICAGVCSVQLHDRVTYYLKYPVSVDIQILRLNELNYPSIVFCYLDPDFKRNVTNLLGRRFEAPCEIYSRRCKDRINTLNRTRGYSDDEIKRYGNWWQAQRRNKTVAQLREEMVLQRATDAKEVCTLRDEWCTAEKKEIFRNVFKYHNTSLHHLWNESNINERSIKFVDSECHEKHINACITLHTLTSFHGSCHVVRKEKPAIYKGEKTSLTVSFEGIIYNSKTSFGVYYQDEGPIYLNNILSTVFDLAVLWRMNSRLLMKKFRTVNSTQRPCLSRKMAADCINNCFVRILGQSLICRLPMMEQVIHLEDCPDWENLTIAMRQAGEVYKRFDSQTCLCLKPCEDTMYTIVSWERENDGHSKITLSLSFASNIVELITESMSYSSAALLSDFGGNLGIFLGVSIVTLVETLDGLMRTFCKCMSSKHKY